MISRYDLWKYLQVSDYRFTRGLSLPQIQRVVISKTELCNWCGTQKKNYFCCDKQCRKKDFVCPQCSSQWLQYPHFMHQVMYVVPFFSKSLVNDLQKIKSEYEKLKDVQINAKMHKICQLNEFYHQIEQQISVLQSEVQIICEHWEILESIIDSNQLKLKQAKNSIINVLNVIDHRRMVKKVQDFLSLYKQLTPFMTKSRDKSQFLSSQKMQFGLSQDNMEQIITNNSWIDYEHNNPLLGKIKKFYSDNLKGLRMRFSQPLTKQINQLFSLQNIVQLKLKGQVSILNLLIVLEVSSLRNIQIDYLTTYPRQSNHLRASVSYSSNEYQYPSLTEQNVQVPIQIIPAINKFRKRISNLISLQIKYPELEPLNSLFSLCSFPHLCRLQLNSLFEPEEALKKFINTLSTRLCRLQLITFSTHIDRNIIEPIIQQNLEKPLKIHSNEQGQPQNGGIRYCIKVINEQELLRRQQIHRAQQNNRHQRKENAIQSIGYFQKTKALMNLCKMYMYKPKISNNVINDVIIHHVL